MWVRRTRGTTFAVRGLWDQKTPEVRRKCPDADTSRALVLPALQDAAG